ncbi:MAG: 50S ribosomal protein L15 [Alphaproteobacteria bacterium]|nr:50S ribosomal protein L15 [Alphaproteobacteria bacterium]
MNLNELSDNAGAVKKRKRAGRGIGSGLGKTAGRGMKGQKSRSGVSLVGFEGGQMPLYRRLPKRGFVKPNRSRYQELTLGRLQIAIDAGKIDAKSEITEDALVAGGVIRRKMDGVRLIGGGELSAKVQLSVTGATKSAVAAVEKAGGTITVRPAPEPVESKKRRYKGKKTTAAAADSEPAETADEDGADASDDAE